MASATESTPRTPVGLEAQDNLASRTVPILASSSAMMSSATPTIKTSAASPRGDPMDISTPTTDKRPHANGADTADRYNNGTSGEYSTAPAHTPTSASTTMPAPAPAAAAAAVHQPKIVQTAFIHKLYNMLEDPAIQHLISWSSTSDSFVVSPTNDFSKVLAQYFKHTNISSFVRQLNMYGFHKVSDVFHTGNPDSALWEFKHGNGNFKRGDLVGLREIKRRASRHALVHREYNQKPTPSQPGTPSEPMPPIHDSADPRVVGVEHSVYDLASRLQRSEENAHYMHIKQQAMVETINRLLQFNQEISRTLLALVPPESPVHRDVAVLQGEIQRHTEHFRAIEEPHEPPFSARGQYFAGIENAPVSPRQMAQDDQRRLGPSSAQARGNFHRPPVPSNLSLGARRPFGSIGGPGAPGAPSSPSPLRSQAPPPAPGPHPLANVELPPGSLARRHTSADIRAHGWQPAPPPHYVASGPPSGPPSSQWPSSPNRAAPEHERLRESLSQYSLPGATQHQQQSRSRPTTPPPPPFSNGINGVDSFNNWSWNSASRENKNLAIKDSSGPPTRRGSMAHILNPSETAERDENDDLRGDDDRKRKRLQ
ncbi:HSF-type DNA-binding-domain-containing protein [Microdochium bolleyi]|uniref:HSF-type DNA-binding-domain-containing protein n=1 Tax=Microdochium bolleyi TaxID=196109 RepID=A0A136JIB7_9PEZI|nr:HSF-type DNA-binding-domain-containing protein [Microdochium bolleyi]